MVFSHTERRLLPLNLRFDQHEDGIYKSTQFWSEYNGRIADNFEVKITMQIPPTLWKRGHRSMHLSHETAEQTSSSRQKTNNLKVLHKLNKSSSHSNIIDLIAYQMHPLPVFYITERFREFDLSKYLLRKRSEENWLSEESLAILTSGMIGAMLYIHSNGILHRDLTASRFALKSVTMTPVLCDFGQAVDLKNGQRCSNGPESDIPLRWSSPKSILDDLFNFDTDAYMLGMTIYQVYTHGCHPFTEHYKMPLEKILEMVIFHDLKPLKAPCFPRPIHELILSLLGDTGANVLRAGRETLQAHLADLKDRIPTPEDFNRENKKYPTIDENQGEPERKLPDYIRRIKDCSGDPRKSYYFNLRKSKRQQTIMRTICEADLLSPDDPQIGRYGSFLTIREPVEISFQYILDLLEATGMYDALGLKEKPQIERGHKPKPRLVYSVEYGANIIELATSNVYGSPLEENAAQKYLNVVYQMVAFVCEMHKHNFILRDICGKTMYLLQRGYNKITTCRLGRVMYLREDDLIDDHVTGETFQERLNWLPIETLDNGQYSFESDVYMLAMTIHEFFTALDLYQDNPSKNILNTVPFHHVKREKLGEHLLRGEVPEKPAKCPQWLYEKMTECWDRDRTQRPSADDLKNVIRVHVNVCDIEASASSVDNSSNSSSSIVPRDTDSLGVSDELQSDSSCNNAPSPPTPCRPPVVPRKGQERPFPLSTSMIKPTFNPNSNLLGSRNKGTDNPCYESTSESTSDVDVSSMHTNSRERRKEEDTFTTYPTRTRTNDVIHVESENLHCLPRHRNKIKTKSGQRNVPISNDFSSNYEDYYLNAISDDNCSSSYASVSFTQPAEDKAGTDKHITHIDVFKDRTSFADDNDPSYKNFEYDCSGSTK